MIVYRVENRHGVGPYTSLDYYSIHGGSGGAAHNHPEPHNDGIHGELDSVKFGFTSIQQFIEWFSADIPTLDSLGFFLAEYEIPENEVFRGGHQCVFPVEYTAKKKFRVTAIHDEILMEVV